MAKLGYELKGFDNIPTDPQTISNFKEAFTRLANDFPNEAKGMAIQFSKTKDSDVLGWTERSGRVIHFNKDFFKDWGAAQSEYAELEKAGHFPKGTDACQRRNEIVRKRRRNFVVFRRGGG